MSLINDGNKYKLPDFFLNHGEQFYYQIEKPAYLDPNDVLVSATLSPIFWWDSWDNPSDPWLSINADGLLTGIANFENQEYAQNYNLNLVYASGNQVHDNFEVFVNSYVEENDWGKDYNYNLNYQINTSEIFGKPEITFEVYPVSDSIYHELHLRARNNENFDILDSFGNNINDSLDFDQNSTVNNPFQIIHSFKDGDTWNEEVINVDNYIKTGDYLAVLADPNYFENLVNFGENDIIQLKLISDIKIQQNDNIITLNEFIPSQYIHQDNIPFEDKVSIDIGNGYRHPIDPSNVINPHNYSGIFINAGADEINHQGTIIPAYSSIAPDGSVLDISAISASEHGLYIYTSPLSDVIYVDSEEGDWPIIKWSAGDDYIVGPTSGAAFRANSYNDWNYEGVSDQGLLFTFDNNVLTVASEYGVITAKNIKNIYGTRGDDTMIGDENYQNFRGDRL